MPQVTGTATEASAVFHVGDVTAQFIDGDTSAQVLTAGTSHFTPDEARRMAQDLDVCADIATQLDGALQDGGIIAAFLTVCQLNGWNADTRSGSGGYGIVAARIRKGTEL